MGSGCSSPLPPMPDGNYLCIAIFNGDSLVILYPDKAVIEAVRNAIIINWKSGIKKEAYRFENDPNNPDHGTCYKFKLNGYPFLASFNDRDQSIQARIMTASILNSLHKQGWKHIASSDLSRFRDLNTWFFQKQMFQPDDFPMFSIGLSSYDKLQINDCPENLHHAIKDVVQQVWTKGIQSEETFDRTYVIKLSGTPWSFVNKANSCAARLMLRDIIQALSVRQYRFYANCNLKGTADTLFFRYDPSLHGDQEFLVISLNRNDRIRLLKTPTMIHAAVREVVEMNWPKGIQEIKDENGCFELKLKGYPWWADGQQAVHSRMLITKIMEKLASFGYFVLTGLDISRKDNDKAVFMFQRGAALQTSFCCVSLNETDKIRFINTPQNLIEAGRSIFHYWPLGLQEERSVYDGVTYQAKLKGNPWCYMSRGDGIHGRAILMGLLCQFNSLGWRLVCSADVSAKYIHQEDGPDYPLDVHSWYFMYDEMMLRQMQAARGNLYPSIPGDQPPTYNPSY